ncbi:hypothetical protein N8368_02795 [Bacteroidia bacterium]|nr:hypothetical protein [Bacteroidia bacterium]MDB9882865.1 hypothetical protein [Bacteroidia bacterium]MDC1395415.1 hypothetical protein [Bacteroidia bacterium]
MKKSIFTSVLILSTIFIFAQLPRVAVVSFDANDHSLSRQELLEILRMEMSKDSKYSIIDKYEVAESLKNNGIEPTTCFSISCLKSAEKLLGLDYVVSGNASKLGDRIFISIRMINTKTDEQLETSKEFSFIPQKSSTMVRLTTEKMLGKSADVELEKSLSDEASFESAVNNPEDNTLNLGGPRMGYTFLTGEGGELIRKPKSQGGYDGYPAFFQMGYQFEKQYLTEGNVQALFEFLPMISGLDQGLFVPSFTLFNGIRSNKSGLEFAVGPSINKSKSINKYLYEDEYYTYEELQEQHPLLMHGDLEKEFKADSRGNARLNS